MAKISDSIRKKVRGRAYGCCEYCLSQESFSPTTFSIEHIVPSSKGGHDILGNLALACQGCNSRKYDKTHHPDPLTQSEVALYHPRNDLWSDHFTWNKETLKLIGISAKGRATIACLNLNRKEVVNLRALLIVFGEHPPIFFRNK